jgi:hypothetical protein
MFRTPFGKMNSNVRLYFKFWFWCVASTALAFIGGGCSDGLKVSPVFEHVEMKAILVGSEKSALPALRATTLFKPEYNFKDCELVLTTPGNDTSNTIRRIMSDCTNAIVRLGGAILTNTNSSEWGFHELTYETAVTKGLFRLYSADLGNSKTKLVAIMLESRK